LNARLFNACDYLLDRHVILQDDEVAL